MAPRVLLVKMSSLGDVVHTLPAVTDLAATGAQIDWVVEEAFAPIAEAHPGVARVIPIAWRRWRKALPRFWDADGKEAREALGDFRETLRGERYDLVIDAQGLYKSALVVAAAQAERKVGLDQESAREGGAARFYTQTHSVARDRHAVDRVRQLVAAAAGYELPGNLDFGVPLLRASAGPGARPRCLLLHGTTWDSKHYPEAQWAALARLADADGYEVCATWGNDEERERARRLAEVAPVTLWERESLAELMARLNSVSLVIGVDSGIAHLSAALSLPTLGLYGPTDAALTGIRGTRAASLSAAFACAPCLSRRCRYQGPLVRVAGSVARPPCFGSLTPSRVWTAAAALAEG